MRYTILIDESSDLSVKDLIEKLELEKEINNKFFIPIYSYIIYEGKVELSFSKRGLVEVDNKIIKKETEKLDLGKTLDDATLEGIKRSLKYLITNNYEQNKVTQDDTVVIYSDRKTVIDSINDKNKYYNEVKEFVDKFNNVEFIWIRRVFNGWADKLAKEGRKSSNNISIELFEEVLNHLIEIKEVNNSYLNISEKLEKEKQDNNYLKKKIGNLENIIKQYSNNNKILKEKDYKLESNKNTYIRIIEKQKKEIQKVNNYKKEKNDLLYLSKKQEEKINNLREINRELQDDLQYYKRKLEEMRKENDELVKIIHKQYTEEFVEEFEMIGTSEEL